MRPRPITALAVPLLVLACGGDDGARVERTTVGDTTIVRTVAGSAWGAEARLEPEVRIGVFDGEPEYMFGAIASLAVAPDGSIYVMDSQAPALRKYGPDGEYLTTFGREGAGPGEYRRPDGGMVVLADGRVVLRDPPNGRLQVYSADGEALATWPLRSGFNTSNPMVADTAGRVYTQVLMDPTAHILEWRTGMLGIDAATGEPVDTVPAPVWDHETPRLMAQATGQGGTSTSVNSVPFSPGPQWTFSPHGHMVGGLSTRYAVDLYHRDGTVLRVERALEPVAVQADERTNREETTRWNMRQTQSDWRWNGPPIPATKPPFQRLYTGADGRVWVQLHQPGERIPDDEIDAPRGENPRPATRWREPVAYDVFEADGTYLGLVRAPRGFSVFPTPVFRGDHVWAVVRDEMDVQYVVRYRVVRAAAE